MKINLKKLLSTLVLIIFISIIYYTLSPIQTKSVVFIPKGSVGEIIAYLSKDGFKMSVIDKYLLFFLGQPQSGWINIGQKSLNKIEFLHKLTVAKAALKSVTLIPGESTAIFSKLLAKSLLLDPLKLEKEFKAQAKYPEGLLYPESYKLPLGIDEKLLVSILLKYAKEKFEEISFKIFGEYNEKKFYEYIIVASVIEKEAANKAEMPIVASVIYNRLKKGMPLQMDGSLNYGLYSHTKVTAARIKEDESYYNTYKRRGLPPVAVCNVGLEAIKAAIFPKKTNYLYFVRDRESGAHIFSQSLSSHNKAVHK